MLKYLFNVRKRERQIESCSSLIMQTSKPNDPYVHGMDWITKLKGSPLSNYRNYQFELISHYIGESVLEIGSGDRSFTELIVTKTPHLKKLLSIEPSQTLFKAYKDKTFGANVVFGTEDLFALDPDIHGTFDTIILVHVLEHIKYDRKALDHLHKLLSQNGRVLIEVPALPLLYSVHDKTLGHYRRYNRKNFGEMVDSVRYKTERLWYQDIIGVVGSLVFFKLLKVRLNSSEGMKLVKNQGGFYDRVLVPISKYVERFITFPFGLSLTGVLRKQ